MHSYAQRQEDDKASPSRQDHRLGSNGRLPCNASNMGKVGAPLATVEPIFPPLSHTNALQHFSFISCCHC